MPDKIPKTNGMHKYQIGDRVYYNKRRGKIVAKYPSFENIFSVEFDEPIKFGHNCDCHAKEGHGWNCLTDELELEPIIVNGEAYV